MTKLNPKSWPLAIKLSLTITAVVTTVGFMIGTVMVVHDWTRAHEVLGEKALLLSESVAITAPKAIVRKDFWSLYLGLKNLRSGNNEIISAMILDAEGRVQAHTNPAKNPMGLRFSPENELETELYGRAMGARQPVVFSSGGFDRAGFQEGVIPVFADQKYLGVVRVRLSVARLYEKAKTSALIVLALVLCFVIIGSALGTLVSRHMVKPLTAVTQGLEAVSTLR